MGEGWTRAVTKLRASLTEADESGTRERIEARAARLDDDDRWYKGYPDQEAAVRETLASKTRQATDGLREHLRGMTVRGVQLGGAGPGIAEVGRQASMARVRAEAGWQGTRVHFVPLGFEPSGAWGKSAQGFFNGVVRKMAKARTRSAELYSWSAMTWSKHWQQRVAVELARGRANVIAKGAAPPVSSYGGMSIEWDRYAI
jgi:hypothetical protein